MARIKLALPDLVQAATLAFRTHGYAGTSMAQLAAATGLTKGAFYHHFRDKGEVMEAALSATLAFAEKRVFDPMRNEERSVADRADVMVKGAERLFRDPGQGCFVANTALAGGPDSQRFRPLLVAFMDGWRSALVVLAKAAKLPDEEGFAVRTIGDIEGAIVLMRVYRDRRYFDEALVRFRQNFPST